MKPSTNAVFFTIPFLLKPLHTQGQDRTGQSNIIIIIVLINKTAPSSIVVIVSYSYDAAHVIATNQFYMYSYIAASLAPSIIAAILMQWSYC